MTEKPHLPAAALDGAGRQALAGERWLVAALAVAAGGLGLLIAWQVLELVPHVTDSVSYLFQGRILAAGRLYLAPPALPPLFAQENVLLTATRWCSIYPPGWPLLLALGWKLHAPWLMSPLLLALAVVGVWLAGRRLYDPATGVLAAATLACSPFALMMAGDSMAHVPALCATVWCLAMLAAAGGGGSAGSAVSAGLGAVRGDGSVERSEIPQQTEETGAGAGSLGEPRQDLAVPAGRRVRLRHLVGAGLLGGFAFLVRPLTAVALLAPAVAWCAIGLARRRQLAGVLWMALGAAPALAALAAYNLAVFGGPLASGYALYMPGRFGHAGAGALVALPAALLNNLPWYVSHLNGCLWGLPWGDLLLLVPLLWARPRRGADAMLAASAAALIVAHSFYYYGDVVYSGPRLAFESVGPLALLAARSLMTLRGWLAAAIERAGRLSAAARRALRLAATGAAACLLLYFPLGRRLPAQMLHHAQWYLAVSAAPLRAGERAGLGPRALVFVAGEPWCYSAFFLANGLHPETAGRVFVRDLPPLRSWAISAYPRAQVWVARVEVEIPEPVTNPDLAKPTQVSWQRLR